MANSENKKIILADKSQTFLMYMGILLRRMGFTIVPAENGLEVLRLLHICDPTIIILDTKLDGVDSATILESIKKDQQVSHIPVVMVSIDASNETVKKYSDLGCSGYLTKPVKLEKLHEALQECIFYPRGIKRKYMRISFSKKVYVIHNGLKYDLYSESLSEMGMYIIKQDPFPKGTEIEIKLPLSDKTVLDLKGTVVYVKGLYGYMFKTPPGMGIKFKDVTDDQARILKDHVEKLLAEGISDAQEDTMIEF